MSTYVRVIIYNNNIYEYIYLHSTFAFKKLENNNRLNTRMKMRKART